MTLNYLCHNKTGNIVTPKSKKIIHYTYEDFIESIVKGNCCFICGAESDSKPFNDEHVIPNWILKHFGTPDSFTTLPNGAELKYSQYKVPCCQECNSELGEKVENFMSRFLRRSYDEVNLDLQNDPRLYLKLFHWMCLVFFKTHYKDCFLRMERDKRKSSGPIADAYCWHPLYHIHSIARKHYTKAQISDNVYGSIIVFEAVLDDGYTEDFDYLDNLNSQVMMIRTGKIVILAVLNDARACLSVYREFLGRITGSLTTVQIRELFARLRYANQNLKERPRFYAAIDRKKGYRIKAHVSKKIEILKGEQENVSLFKLMRLYIGGIMPENLPDRDKLLDDLQNGRAQYIFDEDYNFSQY